jgi:hypothetical protein
MGLDVKDGKAVIDPLLPESLGRMGLKGIHAAGKLWKVEAEGSWGELQEIEGSSG